MSFGDESEIVISISETGAVATDVAVKKVTRSVGDLQAKTQSPINVNIGATGAEETAQRVDYIRDSYGRFAKTASSKIPTQGVQDFAAQFTKNGGLPEVISHLGVEYERFSKIANGPLSSNGLEDFAKRFSKSAGVASESINNLGIEYDSFAKNVKSPLNSDGVKSFAMQFDTAAKGVAAIGQPTLWQRFRSVASGGAKSAEDFARAANTAKTATNRLEGQLKSTTGHFSYFGRIVAISLLAKAAKEVVGLADAFTNLQNKIKVVIPDQNSLNVITMRLVDIANNSRTSISDVATVFSRTSRSVQDLGKSQQETLQFTETLSKAIQVGGSTAVEASNAAIQLSQGLASGALKGDELRSVLEQLPVVAQLIADKFGVGVGELRKMGELGKLTSEKIFDAITEASEKVGEKFKHMNITFEQAWERFKNAALVASQRFQKDVNLMSSVVLYLAEHFDTLITITESLASVITVILVGKAIGAAIEGIKALSIAASTAGGALGLIAQTIVYATAILAPFIAKMEIVSGATATWGDLTSAVWDEWLTGPDSAQGGMDTMKDSIEGLSESTEKWLRYLGLAIDVFNYINPAAWIRAATTMGEYTPIGSTGGREMAEDIIKRANFNIQYEADEAMLKGEQDVLATDMLLDHGKKKDKKPAAVKTSGKSAADLIRELKDGLTVLTTPENENREVNKRLESTLDQLGKGHTATGAGSKRDAFFRTDRKDVGDESHFREEFDHLLGKNLDKMSERDQMESLIRQNVIITAGKKYQAEQEKLIEQSLDDQLKIETDIVKAMDDKSADAGKYQQKLIQENKIKLEGSDKDIKESLNPLIAYNEELQKLEDFKYRNPEYTAAVEKQIASMSAGYKTFVPIMDSVGESLADAAANALIFGDNMETALVQIAKAAAAQALSKGIQMLIGMAMGEATKPGTPTPKVAPPAPQAWNPELSDDVNPYGFASGGYTGNYGINEPAGVVHGQEMVINAKQTARYRPLLEAMNNGNAGVGASAAGGIKVNVHNYVGGEVEVKQGPSAGEIQVMIKKGVQQHAASAVAADMSQPNSTTSKALNRYTEAQRRR